MGDQRRATPLQQRPPPRAHHARPGRAGLPPPTRARHPHRPGRPAARMDDRPDVSDRRPRRPRPAPARGGAMTSNGRVLLPHHRRMLEQASAITPEIIHERGYYSVNTARELRIAFGGDRYADHLPGLMLPLHTVTG